MADIPSDISADFLAEAKRWIGFNTVTTRGNAPFVAHLERRFRRLGFRTSRQRTLERGTSFYNLLARRGPARGRPLLLNTHLDTVPPGPAPLWTSTGGNPWRAVLRRGRLHGLGTADVKLNMLCQWEALRRLGPGPFRRPLCVAGTWGEERGLRGARRLTDRWRGPKPLLALVGEPSEMRPIGRHRGYVVFQWDLRHGRPFRPCHGARFRVSFNGRAAHGSTPELGRNALDMGLDLLRRLDRLGASPRVLQWRGGTAHNQVPARAEMDVAVSFWPPALKAAKRRLPPAPASARSLPWKAAAEGLRRFRAALPASHTLNLGSAEGKGESLRLVFGVRFPPGAHSGEIAARARKALGAAAARKNDASRLSRLLNDPALSFPRPGPWKGLLASALRRAGLPSRLGEKPTCTEAGVYDAWGVPAVVLGPGRSRGNIHRPNEAVEMKSLVRAVAFYTALLEEWCRPSAS